MSKRAHIHRHYEPRVQPERESFDILDWGSASAQEARFAVLAQLMRELERNWKLEIGNGEKQPLRLLDAGCGLADLRAHLRENGFDVDPGSSSPGRPELQPGKNLGAPVPSPASAPSRAGARGAQGNANIPLSYTGVDITPGILAEAQRRQPDATLLLADLFEEEPFPARSFDVVFASGLFNLDLGNNAAFIRTGIPRLFALTERLLVVNFLHVRTPHKHGHCHYTHPEELLEEFRPLAARSEVIADYLPNDFTLVLWQGNTRNARPLNGGRGRGN